MSFIGEVKDDYCFNTIAANDTNWKDNGIPDPESIKKIREIRGWVLKNGQSRVVNGPATPPETAAVTLHDTSINSFMGVPLKGASGLVRGMIALANKDGDFNAADQEEVEHLSFAFVEALERWRSEAALRESEEKYRLLVNQIPSLLQNSI